MHLCSRILRVYIIVHEVDQFIYLLIYYCIHFEWYTRVPNQRLCI